MSILARRQAFEQGDDAAIRSKTGVLAVEYLFPAELAEGGSPARTAPDGIGGPGTVVVMMETPFPGTGLTPAPNAHGRR